MCGRRFETLLSVIIISTGVYVGEIGSKMAVLDPFKQKSNVIGQWP